MSSKVVLQCFETLNALSKDNVVTLTWVPGHSGVPGNEKADELARIGSNTKFIGPQPAIGRYTGLIKTLIRDKTSQSHQNRWDSILTCRQSKEFLVGCNAKNTKLLLGLNREKLRGLVGIVTGHNILNYHLNKIGIVSNPNCRKCDLEPETARHIVCTCPALKKLRTKHLGDFYLTPEEQRKLNLADILSFITAIDWILKPEREL